MNKQTFMSQLKRHLLPLKQSTRQEILTDFEEHFQNGSMSGKTAQQVAQELGDPKELAQQYLSSAEAGDKTSIPENVGRGIFAAFGLLLLDAMIMIPIVASLFAVVVSLWTIPISFAASSIALLIYPLFTAFTFAIPYYLTLLISISFLGLSVATAIGMFYLSKYFIKFVVSFAKMHYRIIVGGSRG